MKLNYLREGLITIGLLLSVIVQAQTWTGGGSNWNDPANWNPGLPTNGATIYIDGNLATVDVDSEFRPDQINIINEGELKVESTLDITGDMYTYITGSNSKLTIADGGLFTSEFITASGGGEIEITGGQLDISDKLIMTDGTFTMTGGLLDSNGIESQNEQLELTNSTFNMTGGEIQFNSSIVVTGGTFTTSNDAILLATNEDRNLEFHNANASLSGTIDMYDAGLTYWGDISLYGTSVVDLQADLTIKIDDLILNDDGQNSTLNIYGALTTFDDLLFDQDTDDTDTPGDEDRIIIKDGGSLDVQDRWKNTDLLNSGSGIHVESGGTLDVNNVEGMSVEAAYGTIVTSDSGASVTLEDEPALPVELIFFEGTEAKNKIELKWSTAVEINNAYFDVLRSNDGEHFSAISRIEGFGNTNNVTEYLFSDLDVSNGTYFYQLKQVDFDGEFEFHNIISIRYSNGQNDELSVFPNPVIGDQFTLKSNRNIPEPILLIYSIEGGMIHEKRLKSNDQWTFYQSEINLPRGIYLLNVKDEVTGNIIKTTRISIAN